MDLPNSGRSEVVNQAGVKVEDVVQTLLEILKEWNISHYLLVVHSLSGIVALKLSHSQLPYAGLVTIEPTTYASIFGDLSEKPYPEWIDLQEKIRISGGTDAYLKEIAEEYLQPSVSDSLFTISQEVVQHLQEENPDFQQPWEVKVEMFDDLQLSNGIPHVLFCQGYRVQEYRTSEYWNDATELVVGGNQHYLQWSQSLEIAIAVKRLAEQV